MEHDLLGEREVPEDARYGVQTLRAVENFPISGTYVKNFEHLIEGLAFVKKAAALAESDYIADLLAGQLAGNRPVGPVEKRQGMVFAADGTLVDRFSMVPCDADPCPSYRPSGPYRTALEVPAGGFEGIDPLVLRLATATGDDGVLELELEVGDVSAADPSKCLELRFHPGFTVTVAAQ